MIAVTVQQPFAHCVAMGAKSVENRTWPVSHRGLIAIHAGRGWSVKGARHPRVQNLVRRQRPGPGFTSMELSRDEAGLVFGAVVAVSELIDCHRARGCCRPWGETDGWHWVLHGTRALPVPVEAVGQLRLWQAPIEPLETLLLAADLVMDADFPPGILPGPEWLASSLRSTFRRAAYEREPEGDVVRLAQRIVARCVETGGTVTAG